MPPELVAHVGELTRAAFLDEVGPRACDALFVFGGTDPGHWRTALRAYRLGYAPHIVVTGGVKPGALKHPGWIWGDTPESRVILRELVRGGVPKDCISCEDRSRNSLENVRFALDVFDFSRIRSLMFVGKSLGAGRQQATLAKWLGVGIDIVPYTFDAVVRGVLIDRRAWPETAVGRARVWGEYLRLRVYGARGDIEDRAPRLGELEAYVQPYLRGGPP